MVGAGVNTLSFASATGSSIINLSTNSTSGYVTDTITNFTPYYWIELRRHNYGHFR